MFRDWKQLSKIQAVKLENNLGKLRTSSKLSIRIIFFQLFQLQTVQLED